MNRNTLEKRIKELAEWFCDNPNYQDIEDAMREFAEDVHRGRNKKSEERYYFDCTKKDCDFYRMLSEGGKCPKYGSNLEPSEFDRE